MLLAAVIMLTQLDGSPLWVELPGCIIIRPATKQCAARDGAGVQIGVTKMCVRETPQQIIKMIRDAK